MPLASKTVAVRDVDGFTSPVKSSTFQSAGCLKDSFPSGNVYVARAAGAVADDDGLPAAVVGPAVAGAGAAGEVVATPDGEAVPEDADWATAPQPARLSAAAVARAAMKGRWCAGRMMVPFMKDAVKPGKGSFSPPRGSVDDPGGA